MTIAESSTPSPAPAPAPPKRRGRWWKILLGIVVVLLLLLLLAPTILSTGFGTSIILGQINKRIAGTVQADTISIGWFSGASITNLRLNDPDGKEVLNIPTLTTNISLLNAINKSFNNLNLVLRGKDANLITNPDGTSNLSRALRQQNPRRTRPQQPAAASPPAAPPADAENTTTQTIHATIDAQFDAITATSTNAAPVTIQNLTTKGVLDTAGGNTDIHLSADAKSGNGAPATITAALTGIFFENGALKPLSSLNGTAEVHAHSIDLAAISPFLSTAGLNLHLTGNSSIDFTLAQSAGAQTATGKITVNNLVATGDLLKGDTLKRNLLTINLTATLKPDSIDLHPLELTTDALNAQLTGTLLTSAAPSAPLPPLTIKSTIDLAALKKDLPHLLGNVPDTQVAINLAGIADTAKKIFTASADSTLAEKDPASTNATSLALTKGSILSWGDAPQDIRGSATINWQRLQQLAGKSLPDGTTLQGTRTIPIHLAGAMGKDPGLNAFKSFTLDPTSIGWDQIAADGFTLGKADLGIQLKNGLLSLSPTDVPANGGTIHLGGRVDLNQTPAAYILDKTPQGTPLIKGVQLNKQIAAGPLAFLPLSWGADKNNPALGEVGGQLNVTLNDAFIPLDSDAFKTKGATSGTLNISNLTTNAPVFSQLLAAIAPLVKVTQTNILNIRGGSIPNAPFALANGKVTYENLSLGTATQSIRFSGSVGLDKSLTMSVQVTASGITIPMPIGLSGTTSDPKLSLAPIGNSTQNLGNSLQGALQQLLNKDKKKK